MVNKVILIGNLGRDPEVRSTPSGQPVASFTLATSRRWRDKNGQKQEQTEWHNIVVWGKQAEIAGPVPHQGQADLPRRAAPDPLLGRPPDRREEVQHRGRLRQLPDARRARRRRLRGRRPAAATAPREPAAPPAAAPRMTRRRLRRRARGRRHPVLKTPPAIWPLAEPGAGGSPLRARQGSCRLVVHAACEGRIASLGRPSPQLEDPFPWLGNPSPQLGTLPLVGKPLSPVGDPSPKLGNPCPKLGDPLP